MKKVNWIINAIVNNNKIKSTKFKISIVLLYLFLTFNKTYYEII